MDIENVLFRGTLVRGGYREFTVDAVRGTDNGDVLILTSGDLVPVMNFDYITDEYGRAFIVGGRRLSEVREATEEEIHDLLDMHGEGPFLRSVIAIGLNDGSLPLPAPAADSEPVDVEAIRKEGYDQGYSDGYIAADMENAQSDDDIHIGDLPPVSDPVPPVGPGDVTGTEDVPSVTSSGTDGAEQAQTAATGTTVAEQGETTGDATGEPETAPGKPTKASGKTSKA